MIKNIVAMLEISDFYGKAKEIDVAKGEHELTFNPIKIYKQTNRKWLRKRK